MDDTAIIRDFVRAFQGVPLDEQHGRLIAGVVRRVNDLARDEAAAAMEFEAEASTFLPALDAEMDGER